MSCETRHSKATGAAATRGGETKLEAAVSSPAWANSSTPCAHAPEVWTSASASGSSARLTTNSPVLRAFWSESLGEPSGLLPGENITVSGSLATALKNEYGARFRTPLCDTVLTQAIGRGIRALTSRL